MSVANIVLGTNMLKFNNTSSVERILTPTILEALCSKYNTWLTVTPTSLPATTFSGDVTLGTYNLKFTRSVDRILTSTMLEALYSTYNTWLTVTPTSPCNNLFR